MIEQAAWPLTCLFGVIVFLVRGLAPGGLDRRWALVAARLGASDLLQQLCRVVPGVVDVDSGWWCWRMSARSGSGMPSPADGRGAADAGAAVPGSLLRELQPATRHRGGRRRGVAAMGAADEPARVGRHRLGRGCLQVTRSSWPLPDARGWMKLGARLPLTSFPLGTTESVYEIDAGARPGGYPGLLP